MKLMALATKYAGALVASVSLASLIGVSSCGSPDAAGGSDAHQYFVSKVYPQIEPTCAGCHASGKRGAPIFLADNPEGSYKAISETTGFIAAPTQSPIMQKGIHSGPALTDVQMQVVTDWLTKEVGTKGDDTKPSNLRAAFKKFGSCMDYNEWKAAGLDKIPTTASGGGQCISCHNTGAASVWLSNNPDETFLKLTQFPYVQRLVTGSVNDKGQFDKIVDSRRLIDKGNDRRQLNANHHPTFNLGDGTGITPSQLQDNLTKFVSNTINKMNRINGCDGTSRPDAGAGDGG
jgi:mono/diheme cytochrome c family protein